MTQRPCKACGTQLFFVISKETKKILPLQLVQAYELEETRLTDKHGKDSMETEAVKFDQRSVFINHYLTCTKPNDFSGSKK